LEHWTLFPVTAFSVATLSFKISDMVNNDLPDPEHLQATNPALRKTSRKPTDVRLQNITRALARHAARAHYTEACLKNKKDSDSEDQSKG